MEGNVYTLSFKIGIVITCAYTYEKEQSDENKYIYLIGRLHRNSLEFVHVYMFRKE